MPDSKRRVVDKRNKEKFFVDDYFLDKFSRIVGPACTVLYMWLCRYANEDGECYPGQEKLAENIGANKRTVRRHLETLEQHNIIQVVQKGLRQTNRYYLLDKKEWLETPVLSGQNCPVQTGQECPIQSGQKSPLLTGQSYVPSRPDKAMSAPIVRVPVVNGSSSNLPVTNVTGQDEPAKHNVINDMFKIFQEINQTINYGNKTERSAAQRIVDRLGEEKALSSARAAVMASKSNDQYAPSITTPLELEKKMGKLVRFFNQKQLDQTRPAPVYSVTV